jgi:hypothetical protein
MAFMSMQGYFWSYNEFSLYAFVISKKIRFPLFELIKEEAALKVRSFKYSTSK